MAIETFGGGLVVAAGSVDTATAACTAEGIRSTEGISATVTRLELLDPLAQAECLVFATPSGAAQEIAAAWVDETHIDIVVTGAALVWFSVWRLPRAAVPAVPPGP